MEKINLLLNEANRYLLRKKPNCKVNCQINTPIILFTSIKIMRCNLKEISFN